MPTGGPCRRLSAIIDLLEETERIAISDGVLIRFRDTTNRLVDDIDLGCLSPLI
jgi:hypothetical protein